VARTAEPIFEAHPNPALGQILFFVRWKDPVERRLRLAIHDVAGREVRTLEGAARRGSALVIWDGCASDGTKARPGAYFAKLDAGGDPLSRKIIVR
jgi:hypothetical protein